MNLSKTQLVQLHFIHKLVIAWSFAWVPNLIPLYIDKETFLLDKSTHNFHSFAIKCLATVISNKIYTLEEYYITNYKGKFKRSVSKNCFLQAVEKALVKLMFWSKSTRHVQSFALYDKTHRNSKNKR